MDLINLHPEGSWYVQYENINTDTNVTILDLNMLIMNVKGPLQWMDIWI